MSSEAQVYMTIFRWQHCGSEQVVTQTTPLVCEFIHCVTSVIPLFKGGVTKLTYESILSTRDNFSTRFVVYINNGRLKYSG